MKDESELRKRFGGMTVSQIAGELTFQDRVEKLLLNWGDFDELLKKAPDTRTYRELVSAFQAAGREFTPEALRVYVEWSENRLDEFLEREFPTYAWAMYAGLTGDSAHLQRWLEVTHDFVRLYEYFPDSMSVEQLIVLGKQKLGLARCCAPCDSACYIDTAAAIFRRAGYQDGVRHAYRLASQLGCDDLTERLAAELGIIGTAKKDWMKLVRNRMQGAAGQEDWDDVIKLVLKHNLPLIKQCREKILKQVTDYHGVKRLMIALGKPLTIKDLERLLATVPFRPLCYNADLVEELMVRSVKWRRRRTEIYGRMRDESLEALKIEEAETYGQKINKPPTVQQLTVALKQMLRSDSSFSMAIERTTALLAKRIHEMVNGPAPEQDVASPEPPA